MLNLKLKENNSKNYGQAAFEYFMIFALVVGLTLLSVSNFLPQIREALSSSSGSDGFFQNVAKGIIEEK
ncbi:MAG: hypothetical protein ABIH27_01540 [Candidatus Omnitrophota bacterium]